MHFTSGRKYCTMLHTQTCFIQKKLTNANLAALITTVNQLQNALFETVLTYVTNLKRFQALYIYICTDIICMHINLNWFLIYSNYVLEKINQILPKNSLLYTI